MKSNFDFLKKDEKLFKIAHEAESLYRDGYFEQTIICLRKFGEIVSKNILGIRRTTEETFDEILGTLSDILNKTPEDKEFIDDLYFLKKQGNLTVHSTLEEKNGIDALECLKRGFEAGLYYALKNNFINKSKYDKLNFSIDILMSEKEYKFSEEYEEKRKDEVLNKEVKKLADFAKEPKKEKKKEDKKVKKSKVTKVDFKNKKRKTKNEPEKEPEENFNIKYYILFGILFVFAICIIIFILPI